MLFVGFARAHCGLFFARGVFNYLTPFEPRRCLGWCLSFHQEESTMTSAIGNIYSDDPDITAERVQQMRDQLTRRINTHPQPGRLINQLAEADRRCFQSTRVLARLIGHAPRVLGVIRAALRKEFEIDPDSLLFTQAALPGAAAKVDSLTDRALLSLALPSVPDNLNQFTSLSVKGDPSRRLPYTPLQVLRRMIAMNLLERLPQAVTEYWQALAHGSWHTRQERWAESYAAAFAEQAFMARQLDEISIAGMTLVQQLVDAPDTEARQRAGGSWASVRVSQLMWPGLPAVAIPGALHIYRDGDPEGAPHVIYLPGVARHFYEYPSFFSLQCGLLALTSQTLFDELWQCLPLKRRHQLCRPDHLSPASVVVRGAAVTEDALALSARALLDGQWANELACALAINHAHVFAASRPRPETLSATAFLRSIEQARKRLAGSARLHNVCDQLLIWDRQRREPEILFASAMPELARLTAEQQVKRYEKGLVALLNQDDPSAQSAAFEQVLALERQRKEHTQVLSAQIKDAQHQLFDLPFWLARPGGGRRRAALFLSAQVEALRCEVELQHQLKLISTAHRDVISEVLDQPAARKRPGSQTQVLSVSVGSAPDAFYPLHNVWVVTRVTALKKPAGAIPVVLYAFGDYGGLMAFSGLEALTQGLKATLGSSDYSRLWGCVERDKLHDLRAHAVRNTLAVRYEPVDISPTGLSLKNLVMYYAGLSKRIGGMTGLFGEVKDAMVSRLLWVVELHQHLAFPPNHALSQALANVDVLRKVALEMKESPPWLASATRTQLKQFQRLKRRYLGSAAAAESGLVQILPDLDTFARSALIARLTEDGFYPELDIDKPLIDLPDDTYSSFCGHESRCTPGDRKVIVTPSLKRHTFSMLQLALHNLDSQAPWTRPRLTRGRYLQPQWRQRLNADYLINTVSSLDIGGNYAIRAHRAFYPAGASGQREERIPVLINRTLRDCAQMQLFSAAAQGLSAQAQSLFKVAMAARTAEDLLKNGHRLTLSVVHLVGHTMLHDRYIAGIVVMADQASGRCVVYWPAAPQALVISEYTSVGVALAALNRMAAEPDYVKVLARQVAPGWAFEAIAHNVDATNKNSSIYDVDPILAGFSFFEGVWRSYEFFRSFKITHLEPTPAVNEIEELIHEQIASAPSNWLAVVPTTYRDAMALLYAASSLELQGRVQAVSNSSWMLATYRVQRLEEQSEATRRGLLGILIPLFGKANDFHDLLLAARRYHRFGDPNDAVDVAFMTLFLAVELATDFAPVPKVKGGKVIGMRSPMKVLSRIRRLPMAIRSHLPSASSSLVTQSKLLDRFRIKGKPEGAVALKGPGRQGVHVKNGEQFIADDTHHYPVYQRESEEVFRLRNSREPGLDELVINIQEPKEWLLGMNAPQPGPSSGVHNPWPVSPLPDWQPPRTRTATENRIVQSRTTDTQWLSWRVQVQPSQIVDFPAAGVFEVGVGPRGSELNARFLRVAPPYTAIQDPSSGFYRMLPQGDRAPLNGLVFITRNEPPGRSALTDIMRWTSTDIRDQPIPVSRLPSGGWQNHPALFDRPLRQYVTMAFPTLTNDARTFAVIRLVELSGPSRAATASHLLDIRATLDEWLPAPPARSGQTDDLLRMLRPNERRSEYLYIGFEGKAPGFTRVDFIPPHPLDPSLQYAVTPVRTQRLEAERAAVRTVLEQQGYRIVDLSVRRPGLPLGENSIESVVTHPRSSTIYYVAYQWFETGRISVRTKLSDKWVRVAINSHPDSALLRAVDNAMQEQRLVRIVAGIQWPTKGQLAPTVYFVKLNP